MCLTMIQWKRIKKDFRNKLFLARLSVLNQYSKPKTKLRPPPLRKPQTKFKTKAMVVSIVQVEIKNKPNLLTRVYRNKKKVSGIRAEE